MKISIGDTVLAGNWTESVIDFTFDGGVKFQDVEYFRGAEPKFFNRKNESATITFTVRRVHNDVVDAEIFALEHMGQADKSGLVTFTAINPNNSRKAERYANGKLTTVGSSFKGKETRVRYTLKIGEMLKKKPETT